MKDFRDELIRTHNLYRSGHGSPDLTLADDLSKEAQEWAEVLSEKGYKQYSESPGRGENVLFIKNNEEPTGEEISKLWYSEYQCYDYDQPKWRKHCINFTQMIWRSSTEIGIGLARVKGQNRYVIVAQYRTAGNGNMPGEFRKNVLPPQ
ncbi:hypothetical protein ScPMuIL_010404 [Solemya velum]